MKPSFAALFAAIAGATSNFGHFPAAPTPAPTRRSRPSKARAKKLGFGLRCCDADRRHPAPWLPNVKGMRYQHGKLVAR